MKSLLLLLMVFSLNASLAQVGDWPPAYWGYSYFGATVLDQTNPANYALVQDKNNGKTYLNSPVEIQFNIGGGNRMFLANNGNFGIGTQTPGAKLEVHGNAAIGQYTNGTAVIDAFNSYAYFGCNTATNGLAVAPNGSIGIGHLPVAGYGLAVAGKTITEEVNVKLQANWPDYVFEKSYDLPSLDEVKSYIDENKHLPEVPSAKEMEKNGINVGEMNMLLLKKVEELTLHLIEQNQKIMMMQSEIDQLKK